MNQIELDADKLETIGMMVQTLDEGNIEIVELMLRANDLDDQQINEIILSNFLFSSLLKRSDVFTVYHCLKIDSKCIPIKIHYCEKKLDCGNWSPWFNWIEIIDLSFDIDEISIQTCIKVAKSFYQRFNPTAQMELPF